MFEEWMYGWMDYISYKNVSQKVVATVGNLDSGLDISNIISTRCYTPSLNIKYPLA